MRKLAILFLLLASCFMLIPSQGLTADFAPVYMWHSPYLGKITMPGAHCRHEAIFCALVAEERFDVRIAYGWPSGKIGKGEAHSQAQAKVGESFRRCFTCESVRIAVTACCVLAEETAAASLPSRAAPANSGSKSAACNKAASVSYSRW